MPSASTIATSLEGNHILDIVDSCKYCKTHNGCYVSEPSQPDSFSSSNNGSISLRISSNPIHHTCTTPATELPGHRGSERIRYLNPGCCNQRVDNSKPQPQMTARGRSTQRRGRLVQLSGAPIVSECFNQAASSTQTTQETVFVLQCSPLKEVKMKKCGPSAPLPMTPSELLLKKS